MDEHLEMISETFDVNPGLDARVKAKMYSETVKEIQAFLNCGYPDVARKMQKIAVRHKNQVERHLS